MPTYIMLSNWTDQGIRHVKESPDRLDAARQLCRQHGAEITTFYMTMSAYDDDERLRHGGHHRRAER
jgi:uncharacterized protein with GYD domain